MFAASRANAASCDTCAARKDASPIRPRRSEPPLLARKKGSCACGGTCSRCRTGGGHHHDGSDHGAAAAGARAEAPAIVRDVLRSPGRPLEPDVRASMEARFDHDFGGVRVHTDSRASESARAVDSVAYTVGSHVAFASGGYDPHSAGGARTLAHELTHVVQQAGATPGASLRIGAADDAREQEADRVAAGVMHGGRAGRVAADHGVQTLRRQTDASVESGTGAGTGVSNGTLVPVPGVHGATFDANFCFSARGCDVRFEFEKAYMGTYPYRAAAGRSVRGVYVKIKMSAANECGTCSSLEAVQVYRDIRRTAAGATETARPDSAERRTRAGWGDTNAQSRGWGVDVVGTATDPFYSHSWVGHTGSAGDPAIIWDTPGHWATDRNVGRDFQTCLVCVEGGQRTTLGCVHWGYYTNSAGATSFTPTPYATCSSTTQLRDATTRWEGIPGNSPVNLRQHSAPNPVGDFPVPSRDTMYA